MRPAETVFVDSRGRHYELVVGWRKIPLYRRILDWPGIIHIKGLLLGLLFISFTFIF